MPSMEFFIESLVEEKEKLINMGSKTSMPQALVEKEGKGKIDPDKKKQEDPNTIDKNSNSKEGKSKKEKEKCS